MIVPGGQAGGGTGGINISWKDFLGIWVGGRGPITENPFLGIPTFTEALEQDLMSQRPPLDFSHVYNPSYPRPGGGGPGQSLTSTNSPPSIEEVGRMVTSGGRSRKSCPPGYRWDGRRCVRKD